MLDTTCLYVECLCPACGAQRSARGTPGVFALCEWREHMGGSKDPRGGDRAIMREVQAVVAQVGRIGVPWPSCAVSLTGLKGSAWGLPCHIQRVPR